MTGPLDDVADYPVVQAGARLGYVVSGVIHLLVGLLAVRLASGDNSSDADQSGALAALAASPLGMVLLATTATGLALLAVTQLARAVRTGKSTDRVKAASKAVAYLALAAGAAGFLLGRESSSVEQSRSFTAMLMALPAGVALVVAVGLVVLGIGGYHLYKGAGRRFRRDLTEEPPRGIVVLGIIGYVAKGVALVAVGVLFVQAALTHDPEKASGLDGALDALLALPFGGWVVGLVAAGFAAFGVYSFARARYARP